MNHTQSRIHRKTSANRSSKSLRVESLESRNLLTAVDLCTSVVQNPILAEDVNRDSHVSAIDIAIVVNYLNGAEEQTCDSSNEISGFALDVSGDGSISARDAIQPINYINRMLALQRESDKTALGDALNLNEHASLETEGEAGTAEGDVSIQIGPSTHLIYNSLSGSIDLDTQDGLLTTLEIRSKSGIFTGDPALNIDGTFDVDRDDLVFKLDANGFPSLSMGSVAQTGLSEQFILDDLVVMGSGALETSRIISSEDVVINLRLLDLSLNRIVDLKVGDEFFVQVTVDDTRFGTLEFDGGNGVSAAYLDVVYNRTLATPVGELIYGSKFPTERLGSIDTPGLLDEVGATVATPTDRETNELFRIRMRATGAGELTFTANSADSMDGTAVFVFGSESAVDPNRINFSSATIQVTDVPGKRDLVQFAKDLDAAGAKFYGAAWCPRCTAQKELFEDGQTFLPFIEVTNFGTDPDRGPNQIANENGITVYPTWIFADNTRLEGTQTIEAISDASGIPIPTSNSPTIIGLEDEVALLSGSPLHIPLDGYDPDSERLTYSVTSDNPDVDAVLITGNRNMLVDVEGFGKMNFQLFEQRVPRATDQIGSLADEGFYNGIIFHRTINDFVIQGGDPTGTGSGGSDREDFDDQYHVDLQHNRTGILSMAKTSDDTNNSQFFITEGPTRHLDGNHSIFGQLIEGEANRQAISNVFTTVGDRPSPDVSMASVTTFADFENGLLMLKAAEGVSGSANITVTVSDELGRSYSESFRVEVTPDSSNSQPFLNDISASTTQVDTPLEFDLTAQDAEGDPVFFYGTIDQGTVTVDSQTGKVVIDPPAGFVGVLTAKFGVDSSASASVRASFDQQDVQIVVEETVEPILPPLVKLMAVSDLGFSDTDNITAADVIGFEVTNARPEAVLSLSVRESDGSLTELESEIAVDSTAVIPTEKMVENGVYEIVVRQDFDNTSLISEPIIVTVARRVMGEVASSPPTEATLGIPITYDVNHPDEPSGSIRYSLRDAPTNVSLDQATGVLTWSPDQLGAFDFSIRIEDLAGNTTTHSFTIDVEPVVAAPAGNNVVDFAMRLSASGATLYGATWDSTTTSQRKLFAEGASMLDFVDVTDSNHLLDATAASLGITVLPTWIFPDGSRLEGLQSLDELVAATGIEVGDTSEPWFADPGDLILKEGSPLLVPLDGFDALGDGLTFHVVSEMSAQVAATIMSGNRQMRVTVAGYGEMVFELFDTHVPELTQHVVELVESGFYNGQEFYRVNDRIIQAGDPDNLGTGSEDGRVVADLFHVDLQHNRSGVLSMSKLVDDGNNTNFFVTSGPQRDWDFHYSIVGQLIEGEDVRAAIESVPKSVGGFPKYPVVIETIEIIENAEDAVLMLSVADSSTLDGNMMISATNSEGNSFERAVKVAIQADTHNSAPFLNPVDGVTTGAGLSARISLSATDVEGDEVRFRARPVGEVAFNVEVNETTGEVIARPPVGFIGTLQLEVSVYSASRSDRVDRYDRQIIEIAVTSDGDLNGDDILNARDIDLVCQAIRDESTDPKFDFDLNGIVDIDDHDAYVRDVFGVSIGDADLSGSFNTDDLLALFTAGTYEDGIAGNSGWSLGDWNCDGEFDSSDLVAAFKNGRFDG